MTTDYLLVLVSSLTKHKNNRLGIVELNFINDKVIISFLTDNNILEELHVLSSDSKISIGSV